MSEESTTPDLVERTRAIFEAMDRDWDIDGLEANWAPDIVWDMSVSVLGTLHGRAAVREFLESWWATWEDHHHRIEEIRDYGYGVVFIALLEDGRPVGSQERVQAQNVMVQKCRRQDRRDHLLHRHRRGPRSRRTSCRGAGVGDVAGERGGVASDVRRRA